MTKDELWTLGIQSIKGLETEQGILASARTEVYGCIFGRDSLITSLALLKVYRKTGDAYFLALVKKVLLNLAALQGKEVNIESGEEPGKCIHEYRVEGHEHLTQQVVEPWYVYADGTMRSYDTVDATPLFLIALFEYLELVPEDPDSERLVAAARAALYWLTAFGDSNGDGFIDYRFPPERIHGGLRVQSWMDSTESLFFETSEERPAYPVAPVEAQAYAYAALSDWAYYFESRDPGQSAALRTRAAQLKKTFNERFVLKRGKSVSLAYAIVGDGRRLVSARSSMAHTLWAVARTGAPIPEGILNAEYVPGLVQRLFAPDLYVASAGLRTLSSRSRRFSPVSYHNGSIWPHDTAMFAEGLENFGYIAEAQRVRESLVRAYLHFKTPIELFGYARGFREYREPSGRGACLTQAWSAASMLSTALTVSASA